MQRRASGASVDRDAWVVRLSLAGARQATGAEPICSVAIARVSASLSGFSFALMYYCRSDRNPLRGAESRANIIRRPGSPLVIDWFDSACKSWGRCIRWILADTGEGFPTRDTIERARQGLLSLGEGGGPRSQHFGEVRLGDALLIANAMKQTPLMPLELQAGLWAHYVVKASPP